jgi:four helix bundle protein
MGDFRKLNVWKESIELIKEIYKYTNSIQFSKDFGLRDQMRRAAVSIASNIAEGDESGTNKQSIRYFNIAKGSCAELLTQFIISFEIGYVNNDFFKQMEEKCNKISAMLFNLIRSRS